MKSVLREKRLLLVANVIGVIWKHMRNHGWPVECAVMCEMMDLHGALCFEAQAEAHYRKSEMSNFEHWFWMTWARVRRAAWKVLWKLGFDDVPF